MRGHGEWHRVMMRCVGGRCLGPVRVVECGAASKTLNGKKRKNGPRTDQIHKFERTEEKEIGSES